MFLGALLISAFRSTACARSAAWRSSTAPCRPTRVLPLQRVATKFRLAESPMMMATSGHRHGHGEHRHHMRSARTRTIDHDHRCTARSPGIAPLPSPWAIGIGLHHSLKAITRSALHCRSGKDGGSPVPHFRPKRPSTAYQSNDPPPRSRVATTRSSTSSAWCTGSTGRRAGRVVASPLNVGSETAVCAHGTLPGVRTDHGAVAQGRARLRRRSRRRAGTPTGAVIVTDYAESFERLPMMRVESIGYGAGDRDFAQEPERAAPAGRRGRRRGRR